ncbi:hemerythrin domain-containing protein [bacterium]|nr:hemerythrin domain-containing protein [bacterium]
MATAVNAELIGALQYEEMVTISPETRLDQLVSGRPWMARILIAFGIDWPKCGPFSLSNSCRGLPIDVYDLTKVLGRVAQGPEGLRNLSLGELTAHIVQCHHRYLRRVLPRLLRQMEEVTRRYPELLPLQLEIQEFAVRANPHMFREEQVVFPAIRDLNQEPNLSGHLARWIGSLLREHDSALEHVSALRQLTVNYQADSRRGQDYQKLMAALADLDDEMRWHMYAENEILFPAALRAMQAA